MAKELRNAVTGERAVEFGWGAPSMIQQFPMLNRDEAVHFDEDNKAIIRTHLRHLITDSQRDAAFKKLTKKIERALSKAAA